MILTIEDLEVAISGVPILTGVSLSLAPGEIVGLVGESGSGKTMTARAILGLLPPGGEIRRGKIRFGDEELTRAPAGRLRAIRGAEIALILQEPMTALNPVFSIGDQLIELVRAHRKVSKAHARALSIAALEDAGLPRPNERFDDYPHQLSGGMRQRVLIAMATVLEPKLILADEPTTALDVTLQAQILALFRDRVRSAGRAVLFVTHDLGAVAEICDRVLVMYAGQIVEAATAVDLFRAPRHPYTKRLLAARPSAGRRGERLRVIEGQVPEPSARPTGCAFSPRCERAIERCRLEAPPLTEAGASALRCFVPEDAP